MRASAATAIDVAQDPTDWRSTQRTDRRVEPVDELGKPAHQVDVTAVDVVEGDDATHQTLALVGHGHPDQRAVESRPPGVGLEPFEPERGPALGVETPTDARAHHPLFEARQVVVVETEPPPDRVPAGQVEDLGSGQPSRRQLQEPGHHAEDRVGLAQRAVGQTHPEIGEMPNADLLVVSGIDRPEGGVDERSEGFDVGAHDHDVAGLEIGIVLEQVEKGVAEDLDLSGPAVTGVDLDASVVRVEQRPGVLVAGERSARW